MYSVKNLLEQWLSHEMLFCCGSCQVCGLSVAFSSEEFTLPIDSVPFVLSLSAISGKRSFAVPTVGNISRWQGVAQTERRCSQCTTCKTN